MRLKKCASITQKKGKKKKKIRLIRGNSKNKMESEVRASMVQQIPSQPINVHLVILGLNSVDSQSCILLICDDRRYLFNCPEGTQRLCSEYKEKLTKVRKNR